MHLEVHTSVSLQYQIRDLLVFFRFLIIFTFVHLGTLQAANIANLSIDGNLRIEKSTIESYLALPKNQEYTEVLRDVLIKRLFATGFFSEVNISYDKNILAVKVKENPLINLITFEGNKRLSKTALLGGMSLKSRAIYSKAKLQQDINQITQLYHRQGCYALKISPKMIELENHRINLVFEINEGPKTLVKNIYFAGNKDFSNKDLKSELYTKETRWYKFWTNADNYDADILELDKENLRKFYQSMGYFDINVISATAELTPSRDGFIITFSLEEGEKYQFGKIEVENKLQHHEQLIKQQITTITGEIYNILQVDQSILKIINALNDQGFPFVNVEPIYSRDHTMRLVDVKYLVSPGYKSYINKINITGNVRTQDKVIRRELRLAEGDPYNATLIELSEQRLRDLDYFKVEVEKYPSETSPGNVDIEIKVEEKSTAKFNIGGGITTEGKKISPIINTSLTEENLFGTGKQAGISLDKSSKTQSGTISFTDPYFMDKNLAAGFDLFFSESYKIDLFPFKHTRIGATLKTGFNLSESLSYGMRYTIMKDNITKISKDASPLILLQKGQTITSLVGHNLTYNRTNSRLKPTKGYWLNFDQSVAGIGGDARFIKHEAASGYYYPIHLKSTKLVLSVINKVGHSFAYGRQNKIIVDGGFNLGGIGPYGLRGFEAGGIGPRSKDSAQDTIGGRFYYKSSTDLTMPINLSKDIDISAVLFFDLGSLQQPNMPKKYINANKNSIFSDHALRVSAGGGLVWESPMGPIKVYFPFVLKKQPYDSKVRFHIEFMNMAF
jgi:outer membrane protein insertion porin family